MLLFRDPERETSPPSGRTMATTRRALPSAERASDWLRNVVWSRDREAWGFGAVWLVAVAHAIRYALFQKIDAHVFSDGHYSWLFARSLAFDFDLDFTNDYAICGDPNHLGIDEGGGRPANPFYFGPAVFLAPVVFVAKAFMRFSSTADPQWRAGCSGPIVVAGGVAALIATSVTTWIGYRLARRFFDEKPSAIAVVIIGLASPLNVFGTLTWYYSHVWAALGVGLALLAAVRAHERPDHERRWLLAGAAAGLAALMRIQETLWLLVPLVAIGVHAYSERGGDVERSHPRWKLRALRRASLTTLAFALVFSVQLLVYAKLYGSPFVVPQGKLYVQLTHAHPWLLLFGARSGLLSWTPLLWFAVLGLPLLARRRVLGVVGAAIVVVIIVGFYVSSAALSWTGAGTMGARVQTSLAVPFTLGAAASMSVILRWLAARRVGAGTVAALALGPWVLLTWEIPVSGVANGAPVTAPALYGDAAKTSVATAYRALGNPWTLPAAAVFGARYHAHPSVFDRVASDGMFQRDYRSLNEINSPLLSFRAPPAAYWAQGLAPVHGDDVGVPAGGRARFLVGLYWPWVTAIEITAYAPPTGTATRTSTLTIEAASFWRTRAVGEIVVGRRSTTVLRVPPDVFDSGINEILLRADGPVALVSWKWIDEGAHDTSVHVFGKPASR